MRSCVGGFLKPETRDAALQQPNRDVFDRPTRRASSSAIWAPSSPMPKAAGWPRDGMLRWGGIWGNTWALDPAKGTVLIVYTNTMWEGDTGFRDQLKEAVFA